MCFCFHMMQSFNALGESVKDSMLVLQKRDRARGNTCIQNIAMFSLVEMDCLL